MPFAPAIGEPIVPELAPNDTPATLSVLPSTSLSLGSTLPEAEESSVAEPVLAMATGSSLTDETVIDSDEEAEPPLPSATA